MAVTQATATRESAIPVRRIQSSDLRLALREGWEDFLARRGDLLIVGLLYPLIGIVAAVAFLGGLALPLFFPIAAGVSLLGPLAAIGFYELARRREAGFESDWSHFFDVRKRPAFDSIQAVAGLLIIIFFAWLVAAAVLYTIFWGPAPTPSVGAFLTRLFTTPEGWQLIVVGNLVGLVFAVTVLAVSVVSLPMLVDCDVEAGTAVSTSIRAVKTNPMVTMQWGVIVAALLVAGSLPFFIGLAVVLPWLGYSTWHLYTRLVDRSALPTCGG